MHFCLLPAAAQKQKIMNVKQFARDAYLSRAVDEFYNTSAYRMKSCKKYSDLQGCCYVSLPWLLDYFHLAREVSQPTSTLHPTPPPLLSCF